MTHNSKDGAASGQGPTQAEKRERRKIAGRLAELHRQGLLVVDKHGGRRAYQFRPGALEWFEATVDYTLARNDGTVTEAHRERVRATWREIKDQVKLNNDRQALMDEVMSPLQ